MNCFKKLHSFHYILYIQAEKSELRISLMLLLKDVKGKMLHFSQILLKRSRKPSHIPQVRPTSLQQNLIKSFNLVCEFLLHQKI